MKKNKVNGFIFVASFMILLLIIGIVLPHKEKNSDELDNALPDGGNAVTFWRADGTIECQAYFTGGTITGCDPQCARFSYSNGELDKSYIFGKDWTGSTGTNYTCLDSSVVDETPPPPPACYANAKKLADATKVVWTNDPPASYYKIKGATEDTCIIISKPKTCIPSSLVSPGNYSTTDCENSSVEFQSKISTSACASSEDKFYTIECTTTDEVKYDIDDNLEKIDNKPGKGNTTFSLYNGQGFKYNIYINETNVCTAKFDSNKWITEYNKIVKAMKSIKGSSRNAWDVYLQRNWEKYDNFIKNDLKGKDDEYISLAIEFYKLANAYDDIVVGYNSFKQSSSDTATATMQLNYSVSNQSSKTNYNYNFSSEEKVCSNSKKVNATHHNISNVSGLTAPQDYVITTNTVTSLYPAKVGIKKSDASITYSNLSDSESSKYLNGGNKVYIANNASVQDNIQISVNLSGVSSNKSTIVNNKCYLDIKGKDLLYRSIELRNPFINSSWEVGQNWLNTTYDFRNTIKSDIWSKSPLYNIELSNEKLSAVRNSTHNNMRNGYSPYLGLCDAQPENQQDNITREICRILK